MKIKMFTQRSWSDDDKPLNQQVSNWLRGKDFSYFKTHTQSLQMHEDYDYLYEIIIFYELIPKVSPSPADNQGVE